jgi:hypothetical protein
VRRRTVAARAAGAASLLHLGLAAVLTWPLAAHLTTSLPYGTEAAPTVGLFNLWTLRWNQDRAGHLFAHYWDAPIFSPTRGAFALSEPQPLTGLVFTPLSWLTGNPVLAANLLLLAILAANGAAAARLVRRLGASPGPALLAGVLAEAMPFVGSQMGVFQLTVVFPLFLLVETVVRWAGGGGRRAAAAIGGWLAVTFLTCSYYGLFAIVGVGLPALVLARPAWRHRDRLLDLATGAGVFAVVGVPVVLAQARITGGYQRTEDLIRNQSALAADFWHLAPQSRGAGLLPWVSDGVSGQYLYPGTALLGLGAFGLAVGARRLRAAADDGGGGDGGAGAGAEGNDDAERAGADEWRRRLWFLGLGFGLNRLLAFGLHLSIGGWEPYRLLRTFVPGFDSLRSPYRFAVLTEVFLVALAGLALDALWRHRPGWRAVPWGRVAAVVVVVAGVLEVAIMPVHLFPVDQRTPEWAAWLDDQPPGSVAFLPFPADGHVASYAPTARHMLELLDVGVPTVNGYSGLFPARYDELEAAARAYPEGRADVLLRELGVSYLVVDAGWLATDPQRRTWLDGLAVPEWRDGDVVVLSVTVTPGRARAPG